MEPVIAVAKLRNPAVTFPYEKAHIIVVSQKFEMFLFHDHFLKL